MPTTINQAFSAAGAKPSSVVKWGTRLSTSASGVYIVSLSNSPNTIDSVIQEAPLARAVFEQWLAVRPELTLDGARPTIQDLMARIRRFWLSDEAILYIGLATSLSARVDQYYRTPIGARRPHAGGYFLKLLSNLDQLWVHYATCVNPARAEGVMLRQFCTNVSDDSRLSLLDPHHPFPFANLEWPPGERKAHGLRGTREPRNAVTNEVDKQEQIVAPKGKRTDSSETQRVTASDLQNGRIRIPATGVSPLKTILPAAKATVKVVLRGQSVRASWNPQMGPDRERSGVLRIGGALRNFIRENEVLMLSVDDEGTIIID